MGEIIRVLMITSSSEGITLKNTRFVHIIEPYWHMLEQMIIGKSKTYLFSSRPTRRTKTVEVFIYLMTLKKNIYGEKDLKLMKNKSYCK